MPSTLHSRQLWIAAVLLVGLWTVWHGSAARGCAASTPALQQMELVEVRLRGQTLRAKLADTPELRRAGMQYLCPTTVARQPLLLAYPEPTRIRLHMRHVHIALDVIIIGADGHVSELRHLPLGGRLRSHGPAVAALELAAGRARQLGVAVGDRVVVEALQARP